MSGVQIAACIISIVAAYIAGMATGSREALKSMQEIFDRIMETQHTEADIILDLKKIVEREEKR